MANKDPYDILGVTRSASQDEIKRAYRRLAKEFHPDRNANKAEAERRFKEVQAAYEVLGDAERRAQYDRFGAGGPAPEFHNWTNQGGPQGDFFTNIGDLGDLSSIFEQFFRRSAPQGRPGRSGRAARRGGPRGADLEHTIELTLEEAARGTQRDVLLSVNGDARQAERIVFKVPAGVRDGQRIRVRGKGHEGSGGRGDLMIRCRIQAHPRLRREGQNLYTDVRLSLFDALRGTQVEVPTLDGAATVRVPAGTAGGAKLRLAGRGLHDPRGGTTGDLFAVVRVDIPDYARLSPRAQALLDDLAEELQQGKHTTAGADARDERG